MLRRLINDELEGIWKETVLTYFRDYTGIWIDGGKVWQP
jgi:hypothetical protein